MKRLKILKTNITELTVDKLSNILINESGKTVAVCNANSLVRSYKDHELQDILNNFDICTPDGFPVAMASKILYRNNQKRVDGFKIFNNTLSKSENTGVTHYLFGNTEEVVTKIIQKYKTNFNVNMFPSFFEPNFISRTYMLSRVILTTQTWYLSHL